MATTYIFDVPGMTQEQYDRVIADLEKAGEGAPKGRLFHLASSQPGGWLVVDVWASDAEFARFADKLMPSLVKAGVTPPKPRTLQVHKIIQG